MNNRNGLPAHMQICLSPGRETENLFGVALSCAVQGSKSLITCPRLLPAKLFPEPFMIRNLIIIPVFSKQFATPTKNYSPMEA